MRGMCSQGNGLRAAGGGGGGGGASNLSNLGIRLGISLSIRLGISLGIDLLRRLLSWSLRLELRAKNVQFLRMRELGVVREGPYLSPGKCRGIWIKCPALCRSYSDTFALP